MSKYTFREINQRVFQKLPYPGILFQPRLEPWYALHQQQHNMSQEYLEGGVRGFYERLGMSMRYMHYHTNMPSPIEIRYHAEVKMRQVESTNGWTHIIETPYGPWGTEYRVSEGGCRISDFPMKSIDDIPMLRWLYEHTEYIFNYEAFLKGKEFLGDLGQPQFWVPRSHYQALCLDYMAFTDFVELAMSYPDQMMDICSVIDDSYDALYEALGNCEDITIINFGENVDGRLLTPALFESCHLPFYEKRSNQLRNKGIFTTVHFDGSLRNLLPFLKDVPFDGLEALTPKPQGDVSLEEIKEAIGDKILLDVIPAILFMPPFTFDDVMKCVNDIVDLFYPDIILGISDEIPMGAGTEVIPLLKQIVEYCKFAR